MHSTLLISLLILIIFCVSDVSAEKNCLTLEKCILLAIQHQEKLKAAGANYNAVALRVKNLKKGTGYRSDLAVSFNRNDTRLRRSEVNMLMKQGGYHLKTSLNMSQKYLFGGGISAFVEVGQVDQNGNLYGEKEDDVAVGVRIEQELLRTPDLRLDLEAEKIKLKEAVAQRNLSHRQVILDTSVAFYEYLKAHHVYTIYSESFEMTEALCNYANAQFINGISTNIDLLEAMTELSLVKANLENAKIELNVSQTNLLNKINASYLENDICSSCEKRAYSLSHIKIADNPLEKIPESDFISRADDILLTHPQLVLINEQIEFLQIETERERKIFQSTLSLEGGYKRQIYGENILENHQEEYNSEWSLGVTYSVPLWDNGITQDTIKSAEYRITSLDYQKKYQYNNFKADMKNSLQSINLLRDVIELSKHAVNIAENNIDLKNKKFTEGLLDIDDVLRARQSLTSAKLSNVDNVIAHNLAISNLEYFLGKDPYLN